MGYVLVNTVPEHILTLSFAQNNELILASTSCGIRIYLTKCFSCISFLGKYTIHSLRLIGFIFTSEIKDGVSQAICLQLQ